MSYRVGLTGGIASGKSTVSALFEQHGIHVIDADAIARDLVEPGSSYYQQVVALFGQESLLENGQLNRSYIRQLIFDDSELKTALEQILHPAIRKTMLAQADNDTGPYVILMVPLLFETGMQTLVNRTLTVDLDETTQIERLCQRDKIDKIQAKAILSHQYSREQRLQLADDIIDNSGNLASLESEVSALHHRYLQLAGAS